MNSKLKAFLFLLLSFAFMGFAASIPGGERFPQWLVYVILLFAGVFLSVGVQGMTSNESTAPSNT